MTKISGAPSGRIICDQPNGPEIDRGLLLPLDLGSACLSWLRRRGGAS